MDNSVILNKKEGKRIGEFIWPFYRFKAVIPNQIGGDIFVWLYLSLVAFVNETKNLDKANYSDDVRLEAEKLINEKFSNIIDHQTFEKIVSNAEKHFIDGSKIKEETFSFLDTYENLFAENCETRMVYQDGVTGEVLPFFGDTSNIDDYRIKTDEDKSKSFDRCKIKDPSSKAIKKAYEQYIKLKKFNTVTEDTEVEFEDEFFDEDEQTFLDNEPEEISFVEEKKEVKSLRHMDVIPVQDTKVELNILVPVYIKNNELSVRSPFGKITDNWLAKCLLKGRNISEDMDQKIKALESVFCIEEKKIQSYIESHRRDFASTLKNCQTLYRLIDSLNDDNMRENVVKLDSYFSQNDIICYFYGGRILDGLIKKINYNKTDSFDRNSTDINQFCYELDNKCSGTTVKYFFLKSKNIFDDWKKKYSRKDGREYMSFKADIADIILRTNLINSPNMYDSFLDDLFNVYGMRNAVDHNDDNVVVSQDKLDKLTKAIRLLFELI